MPRQTLDRLAQDIEYHQDRQPTLPEFTLDPEFKFEDQLDVMEMVSSGLAIPARFVD